MIGCERGLIAAGAVFIDGRNSCRVLASIAVARHRPMTEKLKKNERSRAQHRRVFLGLFYIDGGSAWFLFL